jgi:pimeloyl-ACP methyl ester carboxylesterase
MSKNKTTFTPRRDQALVTAAEWFEEDPYEHRQIPATRQRVPQAEVLTFPGGHLTTSEHPDLLAAAIRDIATRHGVATAAAHQ